MVFNILTANIMKNYSSNKINNDKRKNNIKYVYKNHNKAPEKTKFIIISLKKLW